tara:strand:+ start:904 stop:1173 length:270 start_codon:yes stop_codon:yes gene_type:complete
MGNTIGKIVISYDINKLHTEVKGRMESLGYSDQFNFKGQTKIYNLPNTTLWHSEKSSNQAILDLKSVCTSTGSALEKVIAVLASEFVAI